MLLDGNSAILLHLLGIMHLHRFYYNQNDFILKEDGSISRYMFYVANQIFKTFVFIREISLIAFRIILTCIENNLIFELHWLCLF